MCAGCQLLGLAIYNSVILDVRFPLTVYRKLRGVKPTMRDLAIVRAPGQSASRHHAAQSGDSSVVLCAQVRPDEAASLQAVLEYEGDLAEDMDLRFDVDVEVWGDVKTVELKAGGSDIVVTKDNREGGGSAAMCVCREASY